MQHVCCVLATGTWLLGGGATGCGAGGCVFVREGDVSVCLRVLLWLEYAGLYMIALTSADKT